MWWDKFERKLRNTFEVINKDKGHQVYFNNTKIIALNGKVKEDF